MSLCNQVGPLVLDLSTIVDVGVFVISDCCADFGNHEGGW